ncbi:MAG: sensor histidine kinase [Natronomonas sp.]
MKGERIKVSRDEGKPEETTDRLRQQLAILVHDLESPLNVAQGRLQLARESGDTRHFESLQRVLDRMEQILEDSRYGLERTNLNVEQVCLRSAAERAWEHVERENATLAFDLDHRETIRADEGALLHVLENLFSNAVEHGSSDSVIGDDADAGHSTPPTLAAPVDADHRDEDDHLEVRIGLIDEGFYVEDSGPGIPPDRRSAVFESGYSTNDGGTGLGLSIVRAIVRAHGWKIRVTAGHEGGSRFEILTNGT